MSVSEAADRGYVMVFNRDGVRMFDENEVQIEGKSLVEGKRDPKNRLFYFEFPAEAISGCVNSPSLFLAKANMHIMNAHSPPKLSPLSLLPAVGANGGEAFFENARFTRMQGPRLDMTLPTGLDLTMVNLARTYYEGDEISLWHSRLIHINPKLAAMANPDIKWPSKMECDNCLLGKFHKLSHSGSRPTPENLEFLSGEYLTCDLFGPLLRSAGGSRYVGFYLDLKSRFVWSKLLADKTGHYHAFREVLQDARARSGRAIRFFKTDGDGIFTGGEARLIYAEFHIRHIQSAPNDSASNDIAERVIRTLAELTRTNLLHSGAPPKSVGRGDANGHFCVE